MLHILHGCSCSVRSVLAYSTLLNSVWNFIICLQWSESCSGAVQRLKLTSYHLSVLVPPITLSLISRPTLLFPPPLILSFSLLYIPLSFFYQLRWRHTWDESVTPPAGLEYILTGDVFLPFPIHSAVLNISHHHLTYVCLLKINLCTAMIFFFSCCMFTVFYTKDHRA